MGFQFHTLNKTTIIVEGVPFEAIETDLQQLFEEIIETAKNGNSELKNDKQKSLALSLAKNASIKVGEKLEKEEMKELINDLFLSEMPQITPTGSSILITTTKTDLDKLFN